MSKYYRKINSPFMRDKKGVFTEEFADPAFEEHLHEKWLWDYKWNGTNVGFDVDTREVFGRTAKSMFTPFQLKVVQHWADSMGFSSEFWESKRDGLTQVYGELIGTGIQGDPHGVNGLMVVTTDYRWGDAYHAVDGPSSRRPLGEVIDMFRAGYGHEVVHAPVGITHDGNWCIWEAEGTEADLRVRFDPSGFEGVVGRFGEEAVDAPRLITKLKVEDRWSW